MSVLIGSAADYAGISVDGSQEATYVAKVLALSPIAYWTLGEHEGAVAYDRVDPNQDGAHTAVTLGNVGIGDGQVCPFYDGVASYTNAYSASLGAALNGREGTLSFWAKVSAAGVWTDGARRDMWFSSVDASNYIMFRRQVANNTLAALYNANGTLKTASIAGLSTTGWMHLALTWSLAADELIAYYAGAQSGAAQTGLGTWAGNVGNATIGATSTTPANVWSGYLAHVALWASALTPGQMANLATA